MSRRFPRLPPEREKERRPSRHVPQGRTCEDPRQHSLACGASLRINGCTHGSSIAGHIMPRLKSMAARTVAASFGNMMHRIGSVAACNGCSVAWHVVPRFIHRATYRRGTGNFLVAYAKFLPGATCDKRLGLPASPPSLLTSDWAVLARQEVVRDPILIPIISESLGLTDGDGDPTGRYQYQSYHLYNHIYSHAHAAS